MKQTTCTCSAWVKWLVCGRPTGSCAVHRQDAGPFAEGEVFGTNIIDFDAPDGWVESVAWSPDGYSLVFSSHDSTLYFATFARDGTSTPTIQVRSPSHVSRQLQSSRASCVVGCAWQWLAPYSRAVPQRQGCGCDRSRHDAAAVQAELGRVVVRAPCAGMFTPHDIFPHVCVACCVPLLLSREFKKNVDKKVAAEAAAASSRAAAARSMFSARTTLGHSGDAKAEPHFKHRHSIQDLRVFEAGKSGVTKYSTCCTGGKIVVWDV